MNHAYKNVPELKNELEKGTPEVISVLKNALKLEGSVRNTGTHACGIIIGREDLNEYVPLASVKDSVLSLATQYDGKFIESIGLLKMDFLGLKTLTIIKDTIENIKRSKGVDLDIEALFPLMIKPPTNYTAGVIRPLCSSSSRMECKNI